MDDIEILEDRPFKFEVNINANSESKEKNFLRLRLTFELPENYPHFTPSVRIKNLSPDILDNNNVLELEKVITNKADENIGNQMIFEMCDAIRE